MVRVRRRGRANIISSSSSSSRRAWSHLVSRHQWVCTTTFSRCQHSSTSQTPAHNSSQPPQHFPPTSTRNSAALLFLLCTSCTSVVQTYSCSNAYEQTYLKFVISVTRRELAWATSRWDSLIAYLHPGRQARTYASRPRRTDNRRPLAQLYLKKWWWPVASPGFGVRGHDDRGAKGGRVGWGMERDVRSPAD